MAFSRDRSSMVLRVRTSNRGFEMQEYVYNFGGDLRCVVIARARVYNGCRRCG